MEHQRIGEAANQATFGRRKVRRRVCIANCKRHIRAFLSGALEELGFSACECAQVGQLDVVLGERLPDLVIIGLSGDGVEAGEILETLEARQFDGKVLLLGSRDSRILNIVEELGYTLGIAMLPPLFTPFGIGALRDRVAALLPKAAVASAASEDGLELWYQPKIDIPALAMRGAEALVRIRHPTWGIVSPADFIQDDGDPHLRMLSRFIIGGAVNDWRYFADRYDHRVDIAINLPIAFLQDQESIKSLCQQIPSHPAFEGLIVEIDGAEVIRNLEFVKDIARQLRFHNIAISVDNLGVDWSSLMGLHDFPFVELKVDRKFVIGCAGDRLKQAICRGILQLADSYGARTVAEGVDSVEDFIAVREMGFDLAQGSLFAKPMPAPKFTRIALGQSVSMTT
jgi:EAL domain-containing protein (putative c-di-GMP-specific phosphodiesterase class I)